MDGKMENNLALTWLMTEKNQHYIYWGLKWTNQRKDFFMLSCDKAFIYNKINTWKPQLERENYETH